MHPPPQSSLNGFKPLSLPLRVLPCVRLPGVAFNPDAAANMVNGPQIGVARTYQPVLEDVMELECCLVKVRDSGPDEQLIRIRHPVCPPWCSWS